MLTDVAIWNAPPPPVRYGARGVVAIQPEVTGQKAGDEFTDADYVPVDTYMKTGRAVARMQRASIEVASTVNQTVAVNAGRARAAIELYTSIFNYGGPAAPALSIRV